MQRITLGGATRGVVGAARRRRATARSASYAAPASAGSPPAGTIPTAVDRVCNSLIEGGLSGPAGAVGPAHGAPSPAELWAGVLHRAAATGDLHTARQALERMQQLGVPRSASHFRAFVSLHANSGRIEEAVRSLDDLGHAGVRPGPDMLSTIVDGAIRSPTAAAGSTATVDRALARLRELGMPLCACTRSTLLHHASVAFSDEERVRSILAQHEAAGVPWDAAAAADVARYLRHGGRHSTSCAVLAHTLASTPSAGSSDDRDRALAEACCTVIRSFPWRRGKAHARSASPAWASPHLSVLARHVIAYTGPHPFPWEGGDPAPLLHALPRLASPWDVVELFQRGAPQASAEARGLVLSTLLVRASHARDAPLAATALDAMCAGGCPVSTNELVTFLGASARGSDLRRALALVRRAAALGHVPTTRRLAAALHGATRNKDARDARAAIQLAAATDTPLPLPALVHAAAFLADRGDANAALDALLLAGSAVLGPAGADAVGAAGCQWMVAPVPGRRAPPTLEPPPPTSAVGLEARDGEKEEEEDNEGDEDVGGAVDSEEAAAPPATPWAPVDLCLRLARHAHSRGQRSDAARVLHDALVCHGPGTDLAGAVCESLASSAGAGGGAAQACLPLALAALDRGVLPPDQVLVVLAGAVAHEAPLADSLALLTRLRDKDSVPTGTVASAHNAACARWLAGGAAAAGPAWDVVRAWAAHPRSDSARRLTAASALLNAVASAGDVPGVASVAAVVCPSLPGGSDPEPRALVHAARQGQFSPVPLLRALVRAHVVAGDAARAHSVVQAASEGLNEREARAVSRAAGEALHTRPGPHSGASAGAKAGTTRNKASADPDTALKDLEGAAREGAASARTAAAAALPVLVAAREGGAEARWARLRRALVALRRADVSVSDLPISPATSRRLLQESQVKRLPIGGRDLMQLLCRTFLFEGEFEKALGLFRRIPLHEWSLPTLATAVAAADEAGRGDVSEEARSLASQRGLSPEELRSP